MSEPVPCRLRDQRLELVAFDGKLFKLRSLAAFAPGQPLTLEAQFNRSVTLELKSVGSVKRPDGSFEVRARAMTLHKDARAALFDHFALA